MKNNIKKTLLATLLGASTLVSAAAQAEWSSNAGFVSQYHFRGIQQTAGASASGGFDYESGSFSFGTWAADVQDGLEIDLYGAFSMETEGGFGFSIGATTYQYTGDFDTSYNEVNLNFGKGAFSAEVSVGTWAEGMADGSDASYTFIAGTYEADSGLYGTVGAFSGDIEGSYVEAGYGTTVADLDIGISLIISGSDLSDDEALVFSIGKSF
jgi:uncharacterized protein (TIGR02001 family)